MQTGELTKANEKLAKKAEDASKITPDIDFSTPTVTTHDGPGYVSQEETKRQNVNVKRKRRKNVEPQQRLNGISKRSSTLTRLSVHRLTVKSLNSIRQGRLIMRSCCVDVMKTS